MDRLLNRKELADRLGVHHHTIRNMTIKGQIPAFKIGKQFRYRLSMVESVLLKNNEKYIGQ